MLNYLKEKSNMTRTENGAVTYKSTGSDCLDLFASIGALRRETDREIVSRFFRAFAEDRELAMKILFYGRDVRGGLGERRVFRVLVKWLADYEPESLRRNIALIPEYGRFDDLLCLMGTACEKDALNVIREQLKKDLRADTDISLLAKWLPSVNASSAETVRMGRHIARRLGMTEAEYRRTLAQLRQKIRILENSLREKDYTFDYAKQPSQAMFKYRKAFLRNDAVRYVEFLNQVQRGEAAVHTGTLMPYEIIAPCFSRWGVHNVLPEAERRSMDVTWNALEDFGTAENALVVLDGSGSMYSGGTPQPIMVALSLGIYFAERNTGVFRNHFITFSEHPRLVEIKGGNIAEKVCYCAAYDEAANTNLQAVFELILNAAVRNSVPQEEMPKTLYIVTDMEFDRCVSDAGLTNFERAQKMFREHGYELPDIVFWNVAARNCHQPVKQNEKGAALVSGCTPNLFKMTAGGIASPYTAMMQVIGSERYAPISA